MNSYDLVVLGAGPGGYVAAIRAAQMGMKVAVVENRDVGGTCLNRGCIPTKTLVHASELYHQALAAEKIGIKIEGVGYDIEKMYARKDEVTAQLRGGVEQLFKAHKIELLRGTGTILNSGNILIDGEEQAEVTAGKILIATGSVPARPPIPGLDLPDVVTSDELLSKNDKAYQRLLIIGGGVIGVEFASIFNALGCEITVVEAMDRLLPTMDKEISQNLAMILKKRGVAVHTGSMVKGIAKSEGGLTVTFEAKEQEHQVEADGVLVAIGRRPNTEGLLGEGVELEMDRGAIVVDDNFQTSLPNVYAIGDVIGGIQLAHLASAEGIVAVESMNGKAPSIDLSTVPGCIYTNPEIAAVGLTEQEAKDKGLEVATGKFLMAANGKSLIEMQDRGFIKVVFDKETEVVLGAQLMCARATDLISEFTTGIVNKLTKDQMLLAIRPHPTFTEAVTEAIESVDGHAIHAAPRKR